MTARGLCFFSANSSEGSQDLAFLFFTLGQQIGGAPRLFSQVKEPKGSTSPPSMTSKGSARPFRKRRRWPGNCWQESALITANASPSIVYLSRNRTSHRKAQEMMVQVDHRYFQLTDKKPGCVRCHKWWHPCNMEGTLRLLYQ